MKLTDIATKSGTGNEFLIRMKRQKTVKAWRGELAWDSDLDAMRLDNCNTCLECGDSKCG